jgi:hypothetical protein
MHFNGAKMKAGYALSCRMGLVAQCLKPDSIHGTVAAKFAVLRHTIVVSLTLPISV